jgi:superfamily II DNA or RNA helicase
MSPDGARTSRRRTAVTKAKRRRKSTSGKKSTSRPKKLSRHRKPEGMSVEDWQVGLRRQYGRERDFRMKNIGGEPIFSEFEVTNPETERTYRVAIRGAALGENFCSCPDFAVNTLGTCKHVEFVLSRLEKKRGAKTKLALGYQPPYSEIYLQYGAQRRVVFRPGTGCPPQLKRLARKYFDKNGVLEPEAFGKFHKFLKHAGGGEHEVRCYDDTLAFIAEVRDQERLRENVGKTFPKGVGSAAFRRLVKVPLHRYQRQGALFAARAGRSLLADDMGLGKTVQAIAAAEILARCAGIERVLIVAPTSLKHQWRSEIEKFTGGDAVVIEGLRPRRAELYEAEAFFKITNYDVVYRDVDLIDQWRPDLIVLDEAQRIKNWKTRTAQSVKRLDSPYALVLTGTPLENRIEELHSIVEFIDRHRLGPLFKFLHDHQHVDETGRVVGYRNLSGIARTLEPILLRRTKKQVLDELPERMDKRFFIPMTPQQMTLHEENREIVARVVAKWRRYGFLAEADQLRLQIALQNMRMSCNSTYLLDQKTDFGHKADETTQLLEEVLDQPDSKVVLFSQWLRTHELLVRRLEQRKWEHVLFHGGVSSRNRKGLIKRFKEDPRCRLFLATDAGGVGLNLQNADTVIVLDQPWNPGVLEQRIGRVHRMGQHRPVRVVHFVAQGAIEEGMLGVLAFKKSMFAGVLDGGKDEVFLGGTRLKRFMESVDKVTSSIPTPAPTEPEPRAPSEPEPTAAAEAGPAAAPQQQAWNDVLAAGASLLEKLGQALGTGGTGEAGKSAATTPGLPEGLLSQDERTGQTYVKLPLPDPDVLQKIVGALGSLTARR